MDGWRRGVEEIGGDVGDGDGDARRDDWGGNDGGTDVRDTLGADSRGVYDGDDDDGDDGDDDDDDDDDVRDES